MDTYAHPDVLETSETEVSFEGWPPPTIFIPGPNQALIPLTRGYSTLVDVEDYPLLSRWRWHAALKGGIVYARRRVRVGEKTPDGEPIEPKLICAHQQIAGYVLGGTFHVDHWNRYALDNRKENLRVVLPGVNMLNGVSDRRSALDFLGVQMDPRPISKRFRARLEFRGEAYHCGYFATAQKAADARDDKLYELLKKAGLLKRVPLFMFWELFNFPLRLKIPPPPDSRLSVRTAAQPAVISNGEDSANDIPFAAD